MNMEAIQSAASEALLNVVLAVIALAGAYAVYYIRLGASKLKAQTVRIADEAGRKALEDAISDVERLATLSVGATEQTTAKALREAVKSGNASREELAALGRRVFEEVKGSIAPEAQRVITENLGSFDRYLTNCIEDAVLKAVSYTHLPALKSWEDVNEALRQIAEAQIAIGDIESEMQKQVLGAQKVAEQESKPYKDEVARLEMCIRDSPGAAADVPG